VVFAKPKLIDKHNHSNSSPPHSGALSKPI
jgi:hypothetical protein